jgi:hypothetical protein
MTHVFIDPNSLNWLGLVAAQEGRGPALTSQQQRYFQGIKYQRGSGVLGAIGRFLLPIAKNIVSTVGEEGLAAGTKALSDISQGKSVKEALMEHSKQGLANISGKLQQCGKGSSTKKQRRGRPKGSKNKKIAEASKRQLIRRRQRFDQLSPYF